MPPNHFIDERAARRLRIDDADIRAGGEEQLDHRGIVNAFH